VEELEPVWVCCGWRTQFPDINKLCNVASCWIYEYIGVLLGARPILHISRIRVNITARQGYCQVHRIAGRMLTADVAAAAGKCRVRDIAEAAVIPDTTALPG
jgi:hypothetical protein